jgi:glyoxylase-like metal-dependent hydrolase (beta-lactamase superfamily II)
VDWPHGNTGVIVGSESVLVIDSDFYPSRAAADIALIRKVTQTPVRFLVNTHWHGDHTHGNAVYRSTFKDLQIVGAQPNQHIIALNQARYPRNVVAPGSPVRAQVVSDQAMLARGTDSTGRKLTDAERRLLAQVIAEHETQLREFAEVVVAPPPRLFDISLTLYLGAKVVELLNGGRENRPADVTVYVPNDRVLFTGDIVVHPVPYVFGAYPGPWIPVLRSLESMPLNAVVPGHGPVMRDHRYLTLMRELFEATATRVTELARQGKSFGDIARLIDLSDFRARFVPAGDVTAAEYWDASIKDGLVDRTYQCVTGYRC